MRYQEIKIIQEDEDLFEINMSPGNLDKLASQIDARAGMEFEMIVPGVKGDDPEMEPDYNSDERCRSIDDAVQFFHDGDYNGRREVQRLRERMEEDYQEWKMEIIDADWANDPAEHIYEYLVDNVTPEEIGEIIGEDLSDTDGVTKQQASVAADFVNENELQPYYDNARDIHREEMDGAWDESDWLDARDLDTMSAIENAYEISWPHWTYDNDGENVDIDQVADEFGTAIKRPVNASQRYHGARREAGHCVVEPDGSLDPDDSDDVGLEFVSPPLPLEEMFSDLDKVKAWADKTGCYTNKSTGLHINVSVPEFSVDNLDYIKLALLMGDKYVLEQFDRLGNTYAKSAMDKIIDRVRQRPEDAEMLLVKMKEGLGKLATKVIHSGATDKYTSINTKTGYVEFRSPGGDWLGDKFFNQIKPTLTRFVVALDAAMDPQKYRDEYLKKLYKLLQPKSKDDTLSYFAKYAAGEMPKAALKSFIKQAQLERKIAKDPTGGEKYWWRVGRPGYGGSVEVVATSRAEAIALGKKEYPEWDYAKDMTATPIRPYSDSPIIGRIREPEPVGAMRPTNPDGNYVIFANNSRAGDPPAYRFMAADNDDAEIVLTQWRRENPGDWEVHYDANQRLGQPPVPGSTLDRQRQRAAQSAGEFQFERPQTDIENRLGWPDQTADANYEVVNRNTLRPVYLFIANTDQDAARKYSQIIDAMGMPGAAENYGYRARGSVMPPVDRQGAQSGNQRPAAGGNFTGVWLILDPDGDVIHSFAGVGNVQSDANRVAMQWLRANPGAMQDGVTVVPEMR